MASSRPSSAAPVVERRTPAYGVVLTLFGASCAAAANIVVLTLAVRELGAGPVGQYALLLGAVGVVSVLEGALTTMATQRWSAPEGGLAHRAAPGHAARLLGLGLLAVSAAVALALTALGVGPATAVGLVGAVGAATAVTLGSAGTVGRVRAAERFGLVGAATTAGAVARVVVVALLLSRWGVGSLGAAALAAALFTRVPLVLAMRRTGMAPTDVAVRTTLRESRAFLVLGVSRQLLMLVDLVVIGLLHGTAATGLYRLGAAAPVAAGGLLLGAFEALLPRLAAQSDADRQLGLTQRTGAALAATAGLGFGVLAGLGGPVSRLLVGANSDVAATVVVLLCVVNVLDSTVHLPVLLTLARGGQGALARLVPAQLVINLAARVGLVLLLGPVGAAVGTVVATAALDLVLFPLSAARGSIPVRGLWTHGLLPAAAAMTAGWGVARAVSAWLTGDVAVVVTSAVVTAALWGCCVAAVTGAARRAVGRT